MITTEDLHEIMPLAKARVNIFAAPLTQAMTKFFIDNPLRQAAFIAQTAHESGELRYVQEIASGAAYEGRKDLGNTQPGDGKRFKGRGLLQITGRHNYSMLRSALGLDVVEHPELLESPEGACMSAGWWWQTHGLNGLADAEDFERITRRINGGLNGQEARLVYYQRAKRVLGILT